MKVAYYLDTSTTPNWGGQATSAGLKYLVLQSYPDAKFCPLTFDKLPFRQMTILRRILDWLIYLAVRHDHLPLLKRVLSLYGVPSNIYTNYDVVCFNGEGAIHQKSGHFFRLIGSLYAFKRSGARVYSINQTIDVEPGSLHSKLLMAVYPYIDRVAVREPTSLRLLEQLGLHSELIGDAAYAAPALSKTEIIEASKKYALPKPYIAVTASSALKRDKASIALVDKLLLSLLPLGRHLVFMANTKTDLYIAKQLCDRYQLTLIDYERTKYREAMALIAQADLIVGGRQHPNIFAAKYHVPFIGLAGNTHKMTGVVELLNYPIPAMNWNFRSDDMTALAKSTLNGEINFSQVTVPDIRHIDLSSLNQSSITS